MGNRIKSCIIYTAAAALSACGSSSAADVSQTTATATETSTEVTVTEETAPEYEYTESDKMVSAWFEYMTDAESFSDVTDYQYYARTLGLEKDHFLSADMWEVYYNTSINLNREIDNKDIYLIRLNPNELMDIYSENMGVSVDELCKSLSVTRDQMYYNWGYNPASVDYGSKHSNNEITYSEKEISIFGKYNGESRYDVMRTHMLEVSFDGTVTYSGSVSDSLKIQRRDLLNAHTSDNYLYSAYTDEERNAAFTVNGIGIRAVIPLTLPNAWLGSEQELNITPMINVSPYSYGCTDKDIVNIAGLAEEDE